MESPFYESLTEVYIATLSMDEVTKKQEELKKSVERAGLLQQSAEALTPQTLKVTENTGEEGIGLRIYGKPYQIHQVTDFMKAIGVRYEEL